MHYLAALLALTGIHLLAVASPGPAFVATMRISMQHRRKVAVTHSLGLGCAAFLWALAAVFGVQVVLAKAEWLYRILQFGGGAYLCYIGIQSWRHARSAGPRAVTNAEAPSMSAAAAFFRGFMLNLTNPKVIVFFASIFTAVLQPSWPLWIRGVVLAIVFVDEAGYFIVLALLLSTQKAQAAYRRAKTVIERTAGAVMFTFGGKLIYSATSR
ncbi:LysE family translocator [Terriglobus tenax]|uniref:LysE family translocator n=1 Tax=Terriglobus tenax TaxID=1111115 RepID=UPI0021DFB9CE|nr:LysE family transporter [Terriglobus tenax]